MMKVVKTIEEWQAYRGSINDQHLTIGFVPTMGFLHAGHRSLFERAREECDIVVASIFVNPTQFNNPDDLKKYPRAMEKDAEILRQCDVDVLFAPQIPMMYPLDYRYQVREVKLSQSMEGQHRPGHFDGVLTVVLKLFNLVRPHSAYFGEKDYQQLSLIRDMAKALFLPINVIGCPTVRDDSGLALSSRNSRLSEDGLRQARQFAETLALAEPVDVVKQRLLDMGLEVDYVEEAQGRRFAAVFVEGVRLIDNLTIE